MESPKTITIDGTEHQVADLGPKVQQLVEIRTKWANELADARLNAAKIEAAIRELDRELLAATNEALKPADDAGKDKADAVSE